jgi:predicted amidohydrolase YtcJ
MAIRDDSHDDTRRSISSIEVSRRRVLQGGAAISIGIALTACAPPPPASLRRRPATIIHNAKVFVGTPDGAIAEAVSIGKDGRIALVGTNADVLATAGRRTRVIDAEGATVMAGIVDGHVHPLGAALSSLSPSLHNADLTVADLQAQLQDFLDATTDEEPDGWLTVNDWSPVGLLPAGTVASKSMLDALQTTRPIFIQGSDFHNALVNSRALELAGITSATPDPVGGEIVRDPSGEPTGLLKDSAQDLVSSVIPPPAEEVVMAAAAATMAQMAANGITTFMDAATGETEVARYAALAAAGQLPQRVIPALVVPAELAASPADALAYVSDIADRYSDVEALGFGVVKVFLDGVIEFPAQTAALLEPYLDADGNPTDNFGDLYVDTAVMSALVTVLDDAGWQVHSHAIGDRAVRTAVDAYEAARQANGDNDRRHTIAHLQLVSPEDYSRFAPNGIVASMQLQWAARNTFTLDALEPYIGPERFDRLYPARSLAEHGAALAGGSDWPVDPLNPFNQIETAVDRMGEYASEPVPLGAHEALDRADAVRMHTVGSAHQLHLADSGTLEPTKRADLLLLDRDLMSVPDADIRNARVQLTFVEGRIVYDASATPSGTAAPVAATTALAAPLATRAANSAAVHGTRHAACCAAHRRAKG